MMDTTLFKNIALDVLPEPLYPVLERYFDEIFAHYAEVEPMRAQADEVEFLYRQHESRRFAEIRAAFHEQNKSDWPSFARARWPEVDKSFNLELPPDDPDSLPF